MKQFTIYANESWCDTRDGGRMRCLKHDTKAFYHSEYQGGGNWKKAGTIENLICTFKNDVTPYQPFVLENAKNALFRILIDDFKVLLSLRNKIQNVCPFPLGSGATLNWGVVEKRYYKKSGTPLTVFRITNKEHYVIGEGLVEESLATEIGKVDLASLVTVDVDFDDGSKSPSPLLITKKMLDLMSSKRINGPLTVCVIPRSKREDHYRPDQKFFRQTVADVIRHFINKGCVFFEDGTQCIIRHTDTKTTHLGRSGHGGNGEFPYCGITRDTCSINGVRGKNILLIDDLYTKTVCIDEDAIQALYDSGANSVIFYSVGKTIR